MYVEKMQNNQVIVHNSDKSIIFFSYGTPVAMIERDGKMEMITLDVDALNHSRTTSKWLYKFLRKVAWSLPITIDKKVLQNCIKIGRIQQKNLRKMLDKQ